MIVTARDTECNGIYCNSHFAPSPFFSHYTHSFIRIDFLVYYHIWNSNISFWLSIRSWRPWTKRSAVLSLCSGNAACRRRRPRSQATPKIASLFWRCRSEPFWMSVTLVSRRNNRPWLSRRKLTSSGIDRCDRQSVLASSEKSSSLEQISELECRGSPFLPTGWEP